MDPSMKKFWYAEYYRDKNTGVLQKTGWRLCGTEEYTDSLNLIPPKQLWGNLNLPRNPGEEVGEGRYPYIEKTLSSCWLPFYFLRDPEGEKPGSEDSFWIWGEKFYRNPDRIHWIFFDRRWRWFPLGKRVIFNRGESWKAEENIGGISSPVLSSILRDLLNRGVISLDDKRIPVILSMWGNSDDGGRKIRRKMRRLLRGEQIEKAYKFSLVMEV